MTTAEQMAIIERAERSGHLDPAAASSLRKWMSEEAYASQQAEIADLIRREAFEELQDAFGAVIPFGTGGRRGAMGPGPNRINERTIGESAQGLCRHVLDSMKEGAGGASHPAAESARQPAGQGPIGAAVGRGAKDADAAGGTPPARIVIAHDTRHNSRAFAEVVASVVAANGIEALLFDSPRATPELSYAVRHLRAAAGVVISASHNPPGDNGFKAYWADGGQVVPPHDSAIIDQVVRAGDFPRLDLEAAAGRGLFRSIGADVDRAYIEYTAGLALGSDRDVRIVYTPLHGTGATSVARALSAAGFEDVHPVASQWEPDPDFGGVPGRSPNPENPAALEAGVQEARSRSADLVLGSDPDADRLGAVARHDGGWQFLTGNQIGALLFHYLTETLAARGALREGAVLLKTCVTTDLLDRIAESRGVSVRGDFLVGFKYIGEELVHMGDTSPFVFGTEESHGYLRGPEVRDKDAAQAAVLLAEYAAALKKHGRTLVDGLEEIWTRHGYHADITRSIALKGTGGGVLAKKMMESLRAGPPREIAGERVVAIADRRTGKITDPATGRETGTTRGVEGDLLVLHLAEGSADRISIRPSGTEPKVKMYIQIRASARGPLDQEKARTDERAERLAAAVANLLDRP